MHLEQTGLAPKVSKRDMRAVLAQLELDEPAIKEILVAVPARANAVILYGSYARGDYSEASDIDLLVVDDVARPTRAAGRANISSYDLAQFASANHTLFGTHLARDGVVLHDRDGIVATQLSTFGEIDLGRVWDRVRSLARLLTLPLDEQRTRLDGFVRHARYVLRTATYARAYESGPPCFSVAELSERFNDPDLSTLLSSHPEVHGPPTMAVLRELHGRIEQSIGDIERLDYDSLTDVIVAFDETDLGDSAILVLGNNDGSPYTIIPRVIL